MVRVMINNRVEFVLFPGTLALSPHVFAKLTARHRALFILYTPVNKRKEFEHRWSLLANSRERYYSQSVGEREVTFPSSDLDAVLTVLVAVALAHAIHGDPRCEFRGTPAPDQWFENRRLIFFLEEAKDRGERVLTVFSVVPFSCFEVATDGACTLCAPPISRCSRRIRSSLGTRIPCDCRKTVSPPRCRHPRSWSAKITENPFVSFLGFEFRSGRKFLITESDGWG